MKLKLFILLLSAAILITVGCEGGDDGSGGNPSSGTYSLKSDAFPTDKLYTDEKNVIADSSGNIILNENQNPYPYIYGLQTTMAMHRLQDQEVKEEALYQKLIRGQTERLQGISLLPAATQGTALLYVRISLEMMYS